MMTMKNRIRSLFLSLFFLPLLAPAAIDWAAAMAAYESAKDIVRVDHANQLMQKMYNDSFIDEPIRFTLLTPTDSIDKKVYLTVAEYCMYELGDYDNAITYALKVIHLCESDGDLTLEGECQSLLSVAYFRLADYPKAIKHAHCDLTIQRKLDDKSNMSSALNTLAGIYLATGQHNEAYKYIMQAIPLSIEANDSARMAIQMGMATEILQAMHRSEEALTYAHRAYALDSLRGNTAKAAIRLSQMASALMDLERNDEAEAALYRALPVLERAGIWQSLSICHNQLGEILNRRGASERALIHFEKSLPFFVKVGDKYNEAKARQGAYEALRKTHPAQAMKHLERLSLLKDTLYKQETKRHLGLAHAKYHNEELQMQNAHEHKVRNLTLVLSLAVVAILLAILTIVVLALRNRRRRIALMHQLQEEKEMFFTNITHEFRTPLSIILGLSQRLSERQLDKDETIEGVATIIERQGKSLLDLVNQLLEIARTDRVSIEGEYRTDNVVGYVHMVVEACEELAKRKHIALQYVPNETHVEMKYVPDYLQRIVQNLVVNAIKFTPDYGTVRVSSQMTDDKKIFSITVNDNGKGIAHEFLPYVFDSFAGHKGTNGEVSTGVGLTLVKKMVEALGGRISVESEEGKGSTFRVNLPCDQGDTTTTHSTIPTVTAPMAVVMDETKEYERTEKTLEQTGSGELQYAILVVEDNVDVFYYMEHVLKNEHYTLYHARNGKEGLEKAQALVPDLIVTDVMMPLMDGFELCQELKHSEVTNHIPVIVVTARNTETDKLHGLDCGATCYLSKPFRADELLTQVRNIFEQRRIWLKKFAEQLTTNELHEGASPSDRNPAEEQFIDKVNDYINTHMEKGAISVDALALHMCMSAKQLNRKLPNIVGLSVNNYIVRQRVARACRLLQSTEERINVIAQKCGFDNPSNFSRTFKDTMDCSPSDWRNRNHQLNN